MIQGDYHVSSATLHRFFALHVIAFPLLLLGFIGVHIAALHTVGSNNPEGVEIRNHLDQHGKPKDGIPFHPYYTVKDIMGMLGFLIVFLAIVFYAPTFYGQFFN